MSATRRNFLKVLGATGASAALAGCDNAADALFELMERHPDADFRPPTGAQIDLTAHVINRVTWGLRPGDYQRVAAQGVDSFLEEQLDPSSIDDRRCRRKVASIETVVQPTAELYEHNASQLLLDMTRHKVLRCVYSRRQLYELMVDFWTDHFNIVSDKGDCKWLKAADDRDVIRAHALGRFRDLVRASAVSPAMLIYLDGHDNKVEQPGDRPNENYARELLELHTLGVHGGYTQKDVMEVSRCLSGWTYENRPLAFRGAHVEFDPARHDDGEKHVLGEVIPAGGGADDLDRVIDIVCAHPSTARHLATKLCRCFVADPAPPSAVDTVAAAFQRSHGDIRETLRAMFTSDEFRANRGNLFKRPQRFVVSALRAVDARTNCPPHIVEYLERMGHAPFQYPTPDGYPIEQQPWLGTLLWRWNFAFAMTAGRLEGTTVDVVALRDAIGGDEALAAHALGRAPSAVEAEIVREAPDAALALMLSGPAFQRH